MAEIFDFYVADNRTIKFNPIEPILQEDNGVSVWRFRIPKVLNNIDMSGFAWWFVYINAAKQKYSESLTLTADADDPDNYCIADYTIDYGISLTPGSFTFALEAINANGSGEIIEEWHTKTYSHSVIGTLQGNQAEYSETESDIISALIVQIQQKYNALVGGATPIPVASVSQMTNTAKVYLNTTDKNWYYYNSDSSTWVSGGLYASGIVIDPTLTQSGQAADAKVVGDEIEDLKSAIANVEGILDISQSLFDATTFTISNTSNWTINSLTKTSASFEKNNQWSTGNPTAPLVLEAGSYKLFATFNNNNDTLTLKENGSYKAALHSGDTFTITSGNTYTIDFVTTITGTHTITDLYVLASTSSIENVIDKLENAVDDINNDFDNYVVDNSTQSTEEKITSSTVSRLINKSTGVVSDAGNNVWCVSNTISVIPGEKYLLTATMRFDNGVVAFYDSEDTFKGCIKASDGTNYETSMYRFTNYLVTIPADVTKVIVGFLSGYGTELFLPHSFAKIVGYTLIAETRKWTGKKWVCVGDSLTEENLRASKHYYDYIKDVTGITVVNMGESGSGYARLSESNKAFYQRISLCPTDADVVTIFGSFNDLGAGLDVGTVTDSGTTTLAGCINTTIDNLQTAIPLVNLGIVAPTPWNTTPPSTSGTAYEYVEMIKAICEHRSIPYLDLWRCSNLRPWDANFRAVAYTRDEGSGTHPDENGHKLIAGRFMELLDSLLLPY